MAYHLRSAVTTIGRHPHSDVVISSSYPSISRHHAEIRYEQGRYVLRDTSSTGIRVNGRSIRQQTLHEGDRISLADQVSFVYSSGALHLTKSAGAVVDQTRLSPYPPQQAYASQQYSRYEPVRRSRRDRTLAAVLAIVLGGMGAHKFYLGKAAEGVLYFLFSWTGIPFLIGLIEGFTYLSMSDREFEYRYG